MQTQKRNNKHEVTRKTTVVTSRTKFINFVEKLGACGFGLDRLRAQSGSPRTIIKRYVRAKAQSDAGNATDEEYALGGDLRWLRAQCVVSDDSRSSKVLTLIDSLS